MTRSRASGPHHDPISHADIWERLDKGESRFDEIETQIAALVEGQSEAMIQRQTNAAVLQDISVALSVLPEMKDDIASTKEIVEAWGAVKIMGKFVKWSSGIIAAIVVIVVAVKTAGAAWVSWGGSSGQP